MLKAALYTSGIFFAMGAVAHAVRLAKGFEIVVGGVIVPVWMSFSAALIAALFAVWILIAAQRA